MPLKINSSGGGSVSINAPVTGSNFSLTVPANNATLITSDGGAITGNVAISGNLSVSGNNINPFGGMRNRIINGDMRIDQRNSGASVTASSAGSVVYTIDRWAYFGSQASKFSVQQVTSSAPSGFTYSTKITSLSAYTVGTNEEFDLIQPIEGFNCYDLSFGGASAKTVTLSFWVRSSLTGTFGGSLRNSAVNRSYPFSYTISIADTWTYISITIPGDTTGTWLTNNGVGIYVTFGLGQGSGISAAAGSWVASNITNATGAQSVVGTNGATWYITGVQLEAGTQATPFDWRPYGQELALCQRYYWQPAGVISPNGMTDASGRIIVNFKLPVTMRSSPTFTLTRVLSRGYDGFLVWPSSSTAVNTSLTFNFGATIDAQVDTVGVIFAGSQNSTAGYLNLGQDSVVKISAEL